MFLCFYVTYTTLQAYTGLLLLKRGNGINAKIHIANGHLQRQKSEIVLASKVQGSVLAWYNHHSRVLKDEVRA